jgi:hypothetical protein
MKYEIWMATAVGAHPCGRPASRMTILKYIFNKKNTQNNDNQYFMYFLFSKKSYSNNPDCLDVSSIHQSRRARASALHT